MNQPQDNQKININTLDIELANLLNKYSCENMSDTPDFILAEYLLASLSIFNIGIQKRERWYGRDKKQLNATIIKEEK